MLLMLFSCPRLSTEISPIKSFPTINLSLGIPLIVKGTINTAACSPKCHPKKEMKVKIGATKVVFSISIGQKRLFSSSSGCIGLIILKWV